MLKSKRHLRVLAAACLLLGLAAMPVAAIRAAKSDESSVDHETIDDPGMCHVRAAGPTPNFGAVGWSYIVRNKCSFAIDVQVVLSGNIPTGCDTINPGNFRAYPSLLYREGTEWTIRSCTPNPN
jgi:hypothetical protein